MYLLLTLYDAFAPTCLILAPWLLQASMLVILYDAFASPCLISAPLLLQVSQERICRI